METAAVLEQVSTVLADTALECARLAVAGDVVAAGAALLQLQIAANAALAAQAELAVDLDDRSGYELDRCSSWKAWARDQLHLSGPAAARLLAAGRCQRALPVVGASAREGALSAEHVKHLDFARRHLDAAVLDDHTDTMLRVAVTDEPTALRQVVVALREAVYPEALDEAWIEGMAKEDIQCTPVPGGWHLTGFLDPVLGARFSTVLQSWTAPQGADDQRTAAQRRIDGLDAWLTATLAHGLPSDRGVRPQVAMTLDLLDLAEAPAAATAQLAGFGSIGPRQLQRMLCEADFTAVLTAGPFTTLDVGRTARLGTARQRKALTIAQGDRCAGPECRAPVVHLHHIQAWSAGGPTDLSNLVGLCPRCHRLIHAGHLSVDPTTGSVTRPIARGQTRIGPGCRRRDLPDRARRAARSRDHLFPSRSRVDILRT